MVRGELDSQVEDPNEPAELSVLRKVPDVRELGDGWLWIPTHGTRSADSLLLQAQKVRMAAARPFTASDLRHSLMRRSKFYDSSKGRRIFVPPVDCLERFLNDHSYYTPAEGNRFDVDLPDQADDVLSDTEQVIFTVLEMAPGNALSRRDLVNRCQERGILEGTTSMYLQFGAIAFSPQSNVWTLTGRPFDLEEAKITAVRRRQSVRCEWLDEDTVLLRAPLKQVSSTVQYFPVDFHPFVADKQFQALDSEGSPVGTIVVGANGQSWGYTRFLRTSGAEAGDILLVELSLEDGTGLLRLEESELPVAGISDDSVDPAVEDGPEGPALETPNTPEPVSYTHLTLPTIYSV